MTSEYLRQALFGFAMGDAFGVPYEFKQRDSYDVVESMIGFQSHNQVPGTWSDDTSLSLATINALFEPYDTTAVMHNFVLYLNNAAFTSADKMFDIGIGTRNAIETYQKTQQLQAFGEHDEQNNGNGALMRIWPVAFYAIPASMTLEQVSDELTGLTHGHIRAKLASRFLIYFLRMMPRVRSIDKALRMAIQRINRTPMETQQLMDQDFKWLALSETQSVSDIINNIKHWSRSDVPSSGYVVDTLKAVLWVLMQTSSFKDAIMLAAGLGEDTDTIAALVGLNAIFAYNEFPNEWLSTLVNKEALERELLLAEESGHFN